MLLRILLMCLVLTPSLALSKQVSHTYKTTYSNFKVIKGYDSFTKQGKISLKPCPSCEEKVFITHKNTFLAENGYEKPIEDLMKITLSNRSQHVLVQVNKYNNKVYYIEWGYPEGEPEELE